MNKFPDIHSIGLLRLQSPAKVVASDALTEKFLFNEVITEDCYGIGSLFESGFRPSVIWDIGGNTGMFSLAASLMWPDAELHAWEPQEQMLAMFKANAPNAILHPAAAWYHAGESNMLKFDESFYGSGQATLNVVPNDHRDTSAQTGSTDVTGTEPIIMEVPWVTAPWPDLVKLDCEGAEYTLIERMPCKPRVIVGEFHGHSSHWRERIDRLSVIRPDYRWKARSWDRTVTGILY